MRSGTWLTLYCLLVVASGLSAADLAERVQSVRHDPVVDMLRLDDPVASAYVVELHMRALVQGHLARVTIDLVLRNDGQDPVAGFLRLPLPDGAVVDTFAADIAKQMMPASAVGRALGGKMREAEFQRVDRRQIPAEAGALSGVSGQPTETGSRRRFVVLGVPQEREREYPVSGAALLECSRSSEACLWVYPILAAPDPGMEIPEKTPPYDFLRRIQLSYVTEVQERNGQPWLHIPLHFDAPVPDLTVQVEVEGVCNDVPPAPAEFRFFQYRANRGRMVAKDRAINRFVRHGLLLPVAKVNAGAVRLERVDDGRVFFVARDVLPARPAAAQDVPGEITILWDTSASHGHADHAAEFAFLRAYFARPVFPAAGVTVNLILFGIRAETPQAFVVAGGNVGPLVRALEALHYDGGTRFLCVPPKQDGRPDCYLLFGDGLNTFGKEVVGRFRAPLHALAVGPAADCVFLRHLAAKAGGRFIDLDQVDPAVAAGWLGEARPLEFLGVDVKQGRVEDLVPAARREVCGPLLLSGILRSEDAVLELKYGIGRRVELRREIRLQREDAKAGEMLARYWAGRQLCALQEEKADAPRRVQVFAEEHGLLGPLASLAVMETRQQYLRYGLSCPQAFADAERVRMTGRVRPEVWPAPVFRRSPFVPPRVTDLAVLADRDFLRNAKPEDYEDLYRRQRKDCWNDPQFFLDWARLFLEQRQTALAERVLTNLLELVDLRDDDRAWELWQHFVARLRSKDHARLWERNREFFADFAEALREELKDEVGR